MQKKLVGDFRTFARKLVLNYPRLAWEVVYFWCDLEGLLECQVDGNLGDVLLRMEPKTLALKVPTLDKNIGIEV